ncbi:hypothetical protein [Brevundimonas sp. DC300-4]|uniref:hypothetical protein n=1 Tax=Brevundimonas sp. DC300-4 TaxID=2804594 RepID=UPI003CE819DC
MARLDISQLPVPPARYRIDRLPTDPEGRLLFETRSFSRKEDSLRATGLRTVCKLPIYDQKTAIDLADRLDGPISGCDECLASSRYMRTLRIKIIGNLWQLFEAEGLQPDQLKFFTAMPKGWEFTPEMLDDVDPANLLERFRSQLRRAGSDDVDGWLIAAIHAEFEPETIVYKLHVHGFATPNLIAVIDRLRALPAYRFKPNRAPPIQVSRKPLRDLPYPLGYPFKSFWPSRWIGPVGDSGIVKRQSFPSRIPEPYHSQVLVWLDRWAVSDTILLMKLRVGPDGFVISPQQNAHQFEES